MTPQPLVLARPTCWRKLREHLSWLINLSTSCMLSSADQYDNSMARGRGCRCRYYNYARQTDRYTSRVRYCLDRIEISAYSLRLRQPPSPMCELQCHQGAGSSVGMSLYWLSKLNVPCSTYTHNISDRISQCRWAYLLTAKEYGIAPCWTQRSSDN